MTQAEQELRAARDEILERLALKTTATHEDTEEQRKMTFSERWAIRSLMDDLSAARAAQAATERQLDVADNMQRQTEIQRDMYRDLLGFFVTDEKHGHVARKALGLELDEAAAQRAEGDGE